MASPFSVFRRHQKVMMAVLMLMAMIAFVFLSGPFFDNFVSRRPADPVVVKTDQYGDLRLSNVHTLQQQRQTVLNFLERAFESVVRLSGASDAQTIGTLQRKVQSASSSIGSPSQESVVDTWLLAKRAEEIGMVITNRSVNEFIKELTDDRLTSDDMSAILKQLGTSEPYLFELLRHELLALRLKHTFALSLEGTTPAQRWDYYTRLKQQATIEMVPVAVNAFASKIEDPGDAKLQEFFEQHKQQLPNPLSPDPGFREPHRIAIGYFKAETDQFAATITKEEIRKQYEQNKQQYDEFSKQLSPIEATKPSAEKPTTEKPTAEKPSEKPTEKPSEEPAAEKPPAEAPATEKPADAKQEPAGKPQEPLAKPEAKPETSQPQDKPAQDPPAAQPQPGPAAPSNQEPPAERPAAEKPPTATEPAGSSSSLSRRSPFVFVSYQEQPKEEPAKTEAPAANAAPSDSASPSEKPAPNADQPTPAAGKPEPDAAKTQPPAANASEPASKPDQPAPSAESAAAPPKPETVPETPAEPKEPQASVPQKPAEAPKDPLEGSLGDMIRRDLAQKKIDDVFARLQSAVSQYRSKWVRYVADREVDPNAVEPKRPDFAALAKENGVTYEQTKLMSQIAAQQSDIGKSVVLDARASFLNYAFQDNFDLYLSASSRDLQGDRFLFWKIGDAKERVPGFEDEGVRQQVLEAWRMVQARQQADEKAQQLAAEARKLAKPLKEVFADRPDWKVMEAGPFSWLTHGGVGANASFAPPRLSEVAGVEGAGTQFMRTVFGLQKGGVGVAFNQPQTVAYVIRLADLTPSENVLMISFESDHYGTYREVAFADQVDLFSAWQQQLRKAAGLQWVQQPDDARPQQ